jgi:hypothetical protein
MTGNEERQILERIEEVTGRHVTGELRIWEDTSQYMEICGGMVVRLAGNDYFVTGEANEGRFGIEEQPKYWVKYAVELATGRKKVLKLAFREEFESRIGSDVLLGSRSAEKETRILDKVRGHPSFMQGVPLTDAAGNLVRVIDFVRGPSIYRRLRDLEMDHESYFCQVLPSMMGRLLEAFGAISFLRRNAEQHGDIRNDHLLIESETGRYVWIDFDYQMSHPDYDIWCLGNVLTFVVGKGNHYFHEIRKDPTRYPPTEETRSLCGEDALFLFKHRVANLGKLFPYIPEPLNRILLRFSSGTPSLYDDVEPLIDDLSRFYPAG